MVGRQLLYNVHLIKYSLPGRGKEQSPPARVVHKPAEGQRPPGAAQDGRTAQKTPFWAHRSSRAEGAAYGGQRPRRRPSELAAAAQPRAQHSEDSGPRRRPPDLAAAATSQRRGPRDTDRSRSLHACPPVAEQTPASPERPPPPQVLRADASEQTPSSLSGLDSSSINSRARSSCTGAAAQASHASAAAQVTGCPMSAQVRGHGTAVSRTCRELINGAGGPLTNGTQALSSTRLESSAITSRA